MSNFIFYCVLYISCFAIIFSNAESFFYFLLKPVLTTEIIQRDFVFLTLEQGLATTIAMCFWLALIYTGPFGAYYSITTMTPGSYRSEGLSRNYLHVIALYTIFALEYNALDQIWDFFVKKQFLPKKIKSENHYI